MLKHVLQLSSILILLPFILIGDEAKRPNILLITADDLNWDSLACTGNTMKGISPHLDKLASQGTLYENCFISTPICGPSRNSLYTGQFPETNGYMGHGVQPPTWWKSLNRKSQTQSIARQLNKKNYLTGVVGKHGSVWCKFDASHCSYPQTGFGRDPAKYFAFVKDFLARAKKEDKPFYLAANTHDPHHYWARSKGENKKWFDQGMGSSDWESHENGKPYPDPLVQYTTDEVQMPSHYPNDSRFKKELTLYFDSVNRMDQVIGEILHALEESGLAENTIVLFLSDHGMPWQMSKWSLYPSGTKTPLIIRWPKVVKAGVYDRESVISMVDIAPTLAELAGLPPFKNPDGHSFMNLLQGDAQKWDRKYAFSTFNYMNNNKPEDQMVSEYRQDIYNDVEQYRPSRAINSARFSYIWNPWSDGERNLPRTMGGAVSQRLKKHANNPEDSDYPDYKSHAKFMKQRAPEELYDLSKDPACLNNLAINPEYQKVLKMQRQRLYKVMQETDDHELVQFKSLLMP